MTRRRQLTNGRIFPVDELDGFYIGGGNCVHITFEDEDTVVVDLFDSEAAAYDGNAGEVIGEPILIDLRTGEVRLEREG